MEKQSPLSLHKQILEELAQAWISNPHANIFSILGNALSFYGQNPYSKDKNNWIIYKALEKFNKTRKADADAYHNQS